MANITLFAQVIQHLPKNIFKRIFAEHNSDKHSKGFVGTSRNAVEIQLWTALITILIFAYIKAIAGYNWHLSNLVHSLRLNTFTKISLDDWLNRPFSPPPNDS